jgi:putative transcriptional regulator
MPIAVDIDVMLARRKMAVGELAGRVGITPANLAVLKNGRARAVRFATPADLSPSSDSHDHETDVTRLRRSPVPGGCGVRDDATQAIVPVAVQNQTCHCAPLAVWRSFVYGRLGGCFGVD